jgi:senataxin
LAADTIAVSDAITRLSRRVAGKTEPLLVPSLHKQMWKGSYAAMQGNDAEGMAMVISVVASSAHVDKLTAKAFRELTKTDDGRAVENVFSVVNEALDVFHAGFLDAASKFANYSPSSVILDLFRRPGMVKDIIALMLCPIDDIQVAAQTLVGQAFDVDVRQDCFRALIENLSEASLNGIFNFLDTFIHYASLVPEACSLSKSIVRCMTDVIDVLCSNTDGLLRSQTFIRKRDDGPGPAGELPRWLKLMTQTISVIFNRTPGWSLYFGNEDMVVWMRDALIFGRDMLAQWRVIEGAAVACSTEAATLKPGKMSRIGRRMVEDLKEVLPELGRWLRLTDEELLHQSFALLETLLGCFKETQVPPPEAGITKLAKHVQDARKKDPKRPQTRLDSARLAKLENALSSFQVDDDEIEIVSHTVRGKEKQKGNSDSDVEIVAGPVKKAKEVRKGSPPPARKEGKMRFKPSMSAASSSKASITSFFGAEDKNKASIPPPKAPLKRGQEQPIPAKPHILPPLVRNVEAKKTKPVPSEPSSSSENSDSDESAEEGGLAALAKIQRTPKIKQPTERRQIKMMEVPGQRSAAMERLNRREDLRRTQLRLKPDVTGFHRTLLSWDYDHSGTEPPYHGPKPPYLQVPDKFSDHDQYRRVFEPLFLMECWAQIMKSKDEPDDTYQCTIQSRQFVDDWLDLDISIPEQVKREWRLMDTDVVLLRHLDGKKCILAKTQSYRANHMGITATLRCMVGAKGDPGLQTNTSWRLSKVMRYKHPFQRLQSLTRTSIVSARFTENMQL